MYANMAVLLVVSGVVLHHLTSGVRHSLQLGGRVEFALQDVVMVVAKASRRPNPTAPDFRRSNLVTMASNPVAMASNLIAMASNLKWFLFATVCWLNLLCLTDLLLACLLELIYMDARGGSKAGLRPRLTSQVTCLGPHLLILLGAGGR